VPQAERPRHAALGFAGALVLTAIVVVPLVRRSGAQPAPSPSASVVASSAAKDAELHAQALSAANSLATSLSELSEAKRARARAVEPQHPPPPASSFPSEGACLASYLPELAPVDAEDLKFVCQKSDLWAIERQAHVLFTGKPGRAAQLWKRLGSRSLAALATMRSGCCTDAEALSAVVPGLWCGVLRDKVRLFTALPERTTVLDLERTLACLSRRGARLPAHWATVPNGRSERAFDEFLSMARARR
jgi:hypothetical protein